MDILLHTFSGIAIASVMANMTKHSPTTKVKMYAFGAFGGALPDIDAISLWSKFDTTIGALFHLKHAGKDIYFSKFPYSHHGAMHSIMFALLLILCVQALRFGIARWRKKESISFCSQLKRRKWFNWTFFLAYTMHLIEDMPTPGAVWGGVNFFWPSDTWIGGSGDIWWWNNYDLFLIVMAIIILNTLILIVPKMTLRNKQRFALGICFIGLSLGLYQIKTRGFDFDYEGYAPNYELYEAKSKEIQRQILGNKLFTWMEKLDSKIPLNF